MCLFLCGDSLRCWLLDPDNDDCMSCVPREAPVRRCRTQPVTKHVLMAHEYPRLFSAPTDALEGHLRRVRAAQQLDRVDVAVQLRVGGDYIRTSTDGGGGERIMPVERVRANVACLIDELAHLRHANLTVFMTTDVPRFVKLVASWLPAAWRLVHSAQADMMVHSASESFDRHDDAQAKAAAHALRHAPYLDLYLLSLAPVLATCGTEFGKVASHMSSATKQIVYWEHEVSPQDHAGCAARGAGNGTRCPPDCAPNASFMYSRSAPDACDPTVHASCNARQPTLCASQWRGDASSALGGAVGAWGRQPLPEIVCHCDDWH